MGFKCRLITDLKVEWLPGCCVINYVAVVHGTNVLALTTYFVDHISSQPGLCMMLVLAMVTSRPTHVGQVAGGVPTRTSPSRTD